MQELTLFSRPGSSCPISRGYDHGLPPDAMQLNTLQQDAVVELLNVGLRQAAGSLTTLTGRRVVLDVPQIAMSPLAGLGDALGGMAVGSVASVHQAFSGAIDGDALLVIDRRSAAILKELLTREPALTLEIDASAREVLTEIGNVLLNAGLGTFANLLSVQVSFSAPHLSFEPIEAVVGSIAAEREDRRYVLVVHATFGVNDTSFAAYLLIVLGAAPIDRVMCAIGAWEREQR